MGFHQVAKGLLLDQGNVSGKYEQIGREIRMVFQDSLHCVPSPTGFTLINDHDRIRKRGSDPIGLMAQNDDYLFLERQGCIQNVVEKRFSGKRMKYFRDR